MHRRERSFSREQGRNASRHEYSRRPKSIITRTRSQHLSVRFESNNDQSYSGRSSAKEYPSNRTTSKKISREQSQEQMESKDKHESKVKEGILNHENDDQPSIAQAIEKAFHCLQFFKGEVNIKGRIFELEVKLARKKKRRQEEDQYKNGLEERIRECEEEEPRISSETQLRISNLKKEANKMADEGNSIQAEYLRTEAFDEGIKERERVDTAKDEIRRIQRESGMLTEEVHTYNSQITEIEHQIAIARNLQFTLLDRNDISHPTPPVKRKQDDQNDGEGTSKKKLKESEDNEGATPGDSEELNYEC